MRALHWRFEVFEDSAGRLIGWYLGGRIEPAWCDWEWVE